ncbi:hypothetical protein NPIL_33161 [Nephila pilipes]|uniref:Uncharacterized protein n=1 Tax=Nephila pilipes TaxID=299642 RepID=A0A8X6NEQ4_NEPPI|nr:hypothetical protein NPIL_33161 [Nephila pilipes]
MPQFALPRSGRSPNLHSRTLKAILFCSASIQIQESLRSRFCNRSLRSLRVGSPMFNICSHGTLFHHQGSHLSICYNSQEEIELQAPVIVREPATRPPLEFLLTSSCPGIVHLLGPNVCAHTPFHRYRVDGTGRRCRFSLISCFKYNRYPVTRRHVSLFGSHFKTSRVGNLPTHHGVNFGAWNTPRHKTRNEPK